MLGPKPANHAIINNGRKNRKNGIAGPPTHVAQSLEPDRDDHHRQRDGVTHPHALTRVYTGLPTDVAPVLESKLQGASRDEITAGAMRDLLQAALDGR